MLMRNIDCGGMALSAALLLASCGTGGGADGGNAGGGEDVRGTNPHALRIACSLSAGRGFANDCTVEQTRTEEGLVLTVRHPDGGFRRLLVTRDGRGVIAADGAEPARVLPLSAREIEVAIGALRYRLPATVALTAGAGDGNRMEDGE